MDILQNNNTVLQRQNQIIEQNQRVLNHIVNSNGNRNSSDNSADVQMVRNQVAGALDQIKNQVLEIKKIKNQIASAAQ